jgi:glycosyltransferase involved in cell wall biosynthesis
MSGSERHTVLFINHWATDMGGAEHSLLDILAAMAGRCDCHLVTSEDGRLATRARAAGVSCHVVPCALKQRGFLRNRLFSAILASPLDVLSFVKYVFGVRGLVRRLRPCFIHANVPKSHIALFFLSRLGYRGACCFHMRELFAEGGSAAVLLYGILFPRRRSAVIAISRAVQTSLPKRMREASVVIYNGVAVEMRPKPQDRTLAGMRLLYCGRIVPWKGCHILVEMLFELKAGLPSAALSLTLAGDTSYWPQDYRARLAEDIRGRGLDNCCFLLPNTDDVRALYARHDVFVNASSREPFGRSIAEAQGAGLPVVSFASGGVGEIVRHGDTGFLVPHGDKEAFVKALGKFVEQPELVRTMGDRGYERAKECFNREIQVPKIWEYIMELAADKE